MQIYALISFNCTLRDRAIRAISAQHVDLVRFAWGPMAVVGNVYGKAAVDDHDLDLEERGFAERDTRTGGTRCSFFCLPTFDLGSSIDTTQIDFASSFVRI